MAVNPYFNFYTSTEEQSLTNDLVVESIQIYGHNVRYLPRQYTHVDDIFNEVKNSSFTDGFEIEMYINGIQGFEGDGDLLSKFGVEVRDTQNFVVAVTRFEEEAQAKNMHIEPKEGDLIYFPLTDYLMEIKFVENEEVYYQLGKSYVYRLSCEAFEYGQETVNTGIDEIDDNATALRYTIELTLGSGAGNYEINEDVYQGTDLANATAQAKVADWNPTNMVLTVYDVAGNFSSNKNVVGDTSAAAYLLGVKQEMIFPDLAGDTDNLSLKTEADSIIDFSEDNPFSEEY